MSDNFDDVNEEFDEDEIYDTSQEEQEESSGQSAKDKYDQAKDIVDRIKEQRKSTQSGDSGTKSASEGSASSRGSTADNINREDIPRKKGKASKGTSSRGEISGGEKPTGGTTTGGTATGGTTTGGTAAGETTAGGASAGSASAGGASAGGASAGGAAAGGTAAGGAAAGGTAAGGAAAGGAAAGGAAAGGAAAGGAAAGGAAAATAGVAVVAWPVLLVILIIVLIIVIILLIIGAITFFTTVPGMMMDKITEITSGLWSGFKSFFEGNAAYITEEDQTTLAQYIENMGYDVVGYGFATPEDVELNDSGEIETAESRYLLAYLLADYNTYAMHNDVKDSISSFWKGFWGIDREPLSGMLKFDDDGWLDASSVKIDRDTKTATIKVWNPGLSFGKIFNTDSYTYSLDGWTGRYGKPLEFLLSLHISTMAPDLAYHVASDKEFDTKVHIDFRTVEAYIKLQYAVTAGAINTIKSEDYEGTVLWEIEGLEYLEGKIGADGTLILSATDMATIKDKLGEEGVAEAIASIGMTEAGLKDAVSMCNENGGKGKDIETRQPYITYVEKAWYKNIYFVINDSIRNAVSEDNWLQTAPDFNAYEYTDAGEISLDPYDFHPSSDSDQANIVSTDTNLGTYQVLETKQNTQITQKSQPLKGETNSRIKELFVGAGNDNIEGTNPKPEYYIYDGSTKTAEVIEELRKKEKDFKASGNYTEAEVSEYINSIDEEDVYREIDFNKNSLSALAILENMQTEDADFILRDFKSLLIELKYFKASDLADKYVGLLDWILPDYKPKEWPNRKYEKQNYEYGTYIRSKASMEKIAEEAEAQGEEISPSGEAVTSETVQQSGDGYPNSTEINGVVYRNYKQYSGSYADDPFWGGTMHSHGCGPTAAAIVASAYGELEATPPVMADLVVSHSTTEKLKNALNTYGIGSTYYQATDTQTTVDNIRASLNEGKPVLVLMAETSNYSVRSVKQYSSGGHFLVLLAEENGTLIMSNPGRGTDAGNKDTLGLEAFVRDYMTEYSTGINPGYLIFDEAPNGDASLSIGFEADIKVITPGIGEVTKVSSDSITIKFTQANLVKDFTLTIKGFAVDSSITVGQMLDREQEIGVTTEEDILLILRAPNKAIIENVEDYMPPPEAPSSVSDWELFFWLPFESGGIDNPGNGPESQGACSPGETAVGLIQWTVLVSDNMNNISNQFIPGCLEEDPLLCAPLSSYQSWSATDFWNDWIGTKQFQATLNQIANEDRERFIQVQMNVAKKQYLDPLIELYPHITSYEACTQGIIMHLKVWGAETSWLSTCNESTSDEDIILRVREIIANTPSTAGYQIARSYNEPELALAILHGEMSAEDVEQWVRTKDVSVLTFEWQN